jgi:hypothetical protein
MTLKQLRGVKLSCRSKSGAAQLLMKKIKIIGKYLAIKLVVKLEQLEGECIGKNAYFD